MRQEEADTICAHAPRGRTKFPYFKDRYALMLLAWAAGAGRSVRALRATPFAPLLQKPIVRPVLAESGGGTLSAAALDAVWPESAEVYRLSLGRWSGPERRWDSWYQTSRPGTNLVLQLNFSNQHNAVYRRWLDPEGTDRPFEYGGHPTASNGDITLAWVRLDVDFASGEALVEEVQSDWIGEALDGYNSIKRGTRSRPPFRHKHATAERFARYVETALRPHVRQWSEAALAAALCFLREDLCVRRAYYHTFDGGNALKRLDAQRRQPPRSLYTDLPRRFCFELTTEAPSFLARSPFRQVRKVLRANRPGWFVMDLAGDSCGRRS